MKRIICITGIILIACVITGAVVEEKDTVTANHTQANSTSVTQSVPTYIIKAENGLVTVYRKGQSMPYITTETQVSNLPKSDINILKKGIEVQGDDNLRKTLEDYCS